MDDSAASYGSGSFSSSTGGMRRNPSYSSYDRPDSSSSSNTKKTPSSSGASAISRTSSTPRANRTAGTGTMNSGNSLLQERLRERKVESGRSSATGERGVQSSPVRGNMREEKRPSSSVSGKGMGVKQIEEQVSTLHKQNFDLKLELYHRRQRQESLETRLEAAEKQLEEQAEMQELNEQLLAELERRDQALDEAVGVIVTLEEKVDRMQREREMVRSVEKAPFVPGDAYGSPPPQIDDATPRANLLRMPSFLSEPSEHTEALRSIYLPQNHAYSEVSSLPKLDEESFDGMNSPRLSVLSESSFLSVYGEKLDLNVEPESPKRRRTSSSVEKWVDERPVRAETPTRVSPDTIRRKQFVSINDVLESPLQRLEKLRHTLEKHTLSSQPNGGDANEKRQSRQLKNVLTDNKSFENQHSLPPTPDTFSTNTLRHFKGSNDTLAPDSTFLSTTSTYTAGITKNNYQSTISVRPRSAGETVISRRDGHGWDTSTQADATESGSTSSTYSPSNSFEPAKRVVTPELFNFGSAGPEMDWGRDMMFNHNNVDEPELPIHKRRNHIRRASMVESLHPRNDDTAVMYNPKYVDLQFENSPLPISTNPQPNPPDRRSSLAAVSKLRKSSTAYQRTSPSVSPSKETPVPIQPPAPAPISKKTRLANRLFGGVRNISMSENITIQTTTENTQPKSQAPTQTNCPRPSQQQQRPTYNASNRSQSGSYFVDGGLPSNTVISLAQSNEDDRATPPPIRRSKMSAPTNRMRNAHPNLASGPGVGNVKRISGFGGDGAFDDGAFDDFDGDHGVGAHMAGNVAGGGGGGGGGFVGGAKKRRENLSVDLGVARGLSAILSGGDAMHGSTEGAISGGGGDVGGPGGGGEGKKKWFGGLRGGRN